MKRIFIVTTILLNLLLSGCSSNRITDENYDKVQNGMTLAEVNAIFGEGVKMSGTTENIYAYGVQKGKKSPRLFIITFSKGDRVINKLKTDN